MRVLGVGLVVFGIISLVYGGIRYNKQTTILDVGGIHATATEHKTLPIEPVVGALALIGGIALLVGPGLRRA